MISVDGHPVRGAFTFAVGPNAGPGAAVRRPVDLRDRRDAAAGRRALDRPAAGDGGDRAVRAADADRAPGRATACAASRSRSRVASAVALLAAPVYLLLSTAQFSLRSRVRPRRARAAARRLAPSGAAILDLELCLALFVAAAAIAIALDRPERARRSIAELLALDRRAAGRRRGAARPGRLRPRGPDLAARRWRSRSTGVHLTAGAVWIGGLIGLLVLWRSLPRPPRRRPDRRRPALLQRRARRGAGAGRHRHRRRDPAAADARLAVGDRLRPGAAGQDRAAARRRCCSRAVNLLRTRPRLLARPGGRAPALLRRLVGGEVVLVAGAVFAAAVLTSLAPPAKAVADLGKPAARVGPGRGRRRRSSRPATRSRCASTPTGPPCPTASQVAHHPRRQARHGRRRHRRLRHARHGDGHARPTSCPRPRPASTGARRRRW